MKKLNKEIILGAAIILLGIISWYFLRYVFYVGNLSLGCWILGLGIFILWGIALCLAMLLINNKKVLYGSFILTLVAFGMFFNDEPFYYLIGLIILLLTFWSAVRKIRKEEKIQVNLDFWRIWKRGLPLFITGLILVISLIYYFSPALTRIEQAEVKIPRHLFDSVIKPLENLIEKRLPEGMDLDDRVDKLLTLEQTKELEVKYGIKVEKGDTGRDVLYNLVNFQINDAGGPYKKFIPFGLAIGLFIGLKIVSILYVVIAIMLSYLVLKILIALKFVRIEVETKEVETAKL